jgi:predicted amidohydrolase YtcJ
MQVDSVQDLEAWVAKYWKDGPITVAAHALGDGAVELMIQAMEKAYKAQGPTTKRHQVQHGALIRPDQASKGAHRGRGRGGRAGGRVQQRLRA